MKELADGSKSIMEVNVAFKTLTVDLQDLATRHQVQIRELDQRIHDPATWKEDVREAFPLSHFEAEDQKFTLIRSIAARLVEICNVIGAFMRNKNDKALLAKAMDG